MINVDYERSVHASHVRLGFLSGNCRPCSIARQSAREAACSHPTITVEFVRGEIAKCFRFWDSSFSYMTCPDCGWKGYPEVNEDEDGVDFLDEPKGAGRD